MDTKSATKRIRNVFIHLLPQPEKPARLIHGNRTRAGGFLNILVETRYVDRGLESPAWPPRQGQHISGAGIGDHLLRHHFTGWQHPGGRKSSRNVELDLRELLRS